MEFSVMPEVSLQKENVDNQLQTYKKVEISKQEIDEILKTVNTGDLSTITHFGETVAVGVSKAADVVLNNTSLSQLDNTSVLMNNLSKVMASFDLDELQSDEPKGFLAKIFGDAKKHLDKIMSKYTTVGDEIEKIYIELKRNEAELEISNKQLESIYDSTVEYYKELVKYIAAGEDGVKLIDAEIENCITQVDADNSLTFRLNALQNAREVFVQRVFDLKTAETSALQSIPMLKTLAYTNAILNRKIESTFIVTLPVFKQAIAQAILAKRQKLQAESFKALDERTNEMIEKNAHMIVDNAKLATELSQSSAIKVSTLENSWKTIMDGIEEQKKLTEDLHKMREEDKLKLEALNDDYFNKSSKM